MSVSSNERLTLIKGADLIKGDGSPVQTNCDVVISGESIIDVGSGLAERLETDLQPTSRGQVEIVDLSGHWLMPGLIDAHCHITFGEPSSNDELFFHREQSSSALLAAFNVEKLLLAGVTGFLDADCIFNLGPALRDAIEAHVVTGPRMKSGLNALLTAAGGTAGRLIPDSGVLGYAQIVRNRDEMVTMTRQQVKYGADWIKIHVTGLIPGQAGEVCVWNLDELKAVVETAHELNTPVLAHCRSAQSTKLAAEAGVDLILHASFIDDSALESVLKAKAAIAPTFTFLANLVDYGSRVGAMNTQVDLFRGEIEATATMLQKAHRLGVDLLCGSESGFSLTPYGHWHAREAQLFVSELGLDPLSAIKCATYNGAKALKAQPGSIGCVTAGALADLIAFDRDPTIDIGVLSSKQHLKFVMCRGRQINLNRPWPKRDTLPGEKVGLWSARPLTREAAGL